MDPLIKWTGSKRRIADSIISKFPDQVETYYEPFLGGAHVLIESIRSNHFQANRYIGSDICEPLIEIYKLLRDQPLRLYESYKNHWNTFQNDPEHYYQVRESFNESKSPLDFLFLTRTCYNGLIRFNGSGEI